MSAASLFAHIVDIKQQHVALSPTVAKRRPRPLQLAVYWPSLATRWRWIISSATLRTHFLSGKNPMSYCKTPRAKAQRAQTAKAAHDKILKNGGIRLSAILEAPYAQQFEALSNEKGSKKAALLHLLDYYQRGQKQ